MRPISVTGSDREQRPDWVRWVVTFAAVVLCAASLIHIGRMSVGMATSALSTDEFGTVLTFSSKGPIAVVTDYRAPKNHIFFNLLNSVIPGNRLLDAWRARLLSLAATVLVAAAIIVFFARWDRIFEGSILLVLTSFSPAMLDASMEARGYGFLALAGLVASAAAIEYLRALRRGWLVLLAVSVVLGTYTVPNFVFFGAPLMAFTWLASRRREALIFGAAAAAGILILYAPVLLQMIDAFRGFQDDPEMDFARIDGVFRTLQLYLLPFPAPMLYLIFLTFVGAPFFVVRSRESSGPMVVLLASLACFFVLLILKTPPVRVAAFNTIPFAMAGLLAVGGWMRVALPGWRVMLPVVAVVGFLASGVWNGLAKLRFLPSEDWLTAGMFVDAAFPVSQKVDFETYAKYLKHYVADPMARSAAYDASAWERGELIVADAANKWAGGDRFVPPATAGGAVQIRIPASIRDVVLSFRPTNDQRPSGLHPVLTDGIMQSGRPASDPITIPVSAPQGIRALVLVTDRAVERRNVSIRVVDRITGEEIAVDDLLVAGNAIVISLLRTNAAELEVTAQINPPPPTRIVEIFWTPN